MTHDHVLVGESGVSMPANQYDLIVFVTIFVIKKLVWKIITVRFLISEKKKTWEKKCALFISSENF